MNRVDRERTMCVLETWRHLQAARDALQAAPVAGVQCNRPEAEAAVSAAMAVLGRYPIPMR